MPETEKFSESLSQHVGDFLIKCAVLIENVRGGGEGLEEEGGEGRGLADQLDDGEAEREDDKRRYGLTLTQGTWGLTLLCPTLLCPTLRCSALRCSAAEAEAGGVSHTLPILFV